MSLTACWVLTEHNDWEGEVWHFYVPLGGNEEAIQIIEEYLGRLLAEFEVDGSGGDFPYKTCRKEVHLPTIEHLPGGGYMPEHNVVEKLDLAKVRAVNWHEPHDNDPEMLKDHLYKGGLRELAAEGAP